MGAEDRLYPVDRMMPLARLLAYASMKVMPACGHLAPLGAPEQFVSALRELKVLIEHQQM
jgi:pimeloyl-ACP methyl ester carboxylesterase